MGQVGRVRVAACHHRQHLCRRADVRWAYGMWSIAMGRGNRRRAARRWARISSRLHDAPRGSQKCFYQLGVGLSRERGAANVGCMENGKRSTSQLKLLERVLERPVAQHVCFTRRLSLRCGSQVTIESLLHPHLLSRYDVRRTDVGPHRAYSHLHSTTAHVSSDPKPSDVRLSAQRGTSKTAFDDAHPATAVLHQRNHHHVAFSIFYRPRRPP